MEIQEKIEALRKEIEYHVERYYNQDDPEITDYEYDQKMNELKRLEREHPELSLIHISEPTRRS